MRSLADAISFRQNIRTLWLRNNPITVVGARLIMKAAVDNAVCEFVGIDFEYYYDDDAIGMMNILDDRSKQGVRSYFHNVANNYCYVYGNRKVMNIFVMVVMAINFCC